MSKQSKALKRAKTKLALKAQHALVKYLRGRNLITYGMRTNKSIVKNLLIENNISKVKYINKDQFLIDSAELLCDPRLFKRPKPPVAKKKSLDPCRIYSKVTITKFDEKPDKPFCQTKEFLSSWEWTTLRYKVLQKYGRKCMCCGATPETGAVICVDHIKPRHTHPELALDENNLQCLCQPCNKGKGAWDETDFRIQKLDEQ